MSGQGRRSGVPHKSSDKTDRPRPAWMQDKGLLPKEPPGGKKKRGASMPPPRKDDAGE
jgi:hypothetical protein